MHVLATFRTDRPRILHAKPPQPLPYHAETASRLTRSAFTVTPTNARGYPDCGRKQYEELRSRPPRRTVSGGRPPSCVPRTEARGQDAIACAAPASANSSATSSAQPVDSLLGFPRTRIESAFRIGRRPFAPSMGTSPSPDPPGSGSVVDVAVQHVSFQRPAVLRSPRVMRGCAKFAVAADKVVHHVRIHCAWPAHCPPRPTPRTCRRHPPGPACCAATAGCRSLRSAKDARRYRYGNVPAGTIIALR